MVFLFLANHRIIQLSKSIQINIKITVVLRQNYLSIYLSIKITGLLPQRRKFEDEMMQRIAVDKQAREQALEP